jgi:hypothetical protein
MTLGHLIQRNPFFCPRLIYDKLLPAFLWPRSIICTIYASLKGLRKYFVTLPDNSLTGIPYFRHKDDTEIILTATGTSHWFWMIAHSCFQSAFTILISSNYHLGFLCKFSKHRKVSLMHGITYVSEVRHRVLWGNQFFVSMYL